MKITSIDSYNGWCSSGCYQVIVRGDIEHQGLCDRFAVVFEQIGAKFDLFLHFKNNYIKDDVDPQKILTMLTSCIKKHGAWIVWSDNNVENISDMLLEDVNNWRSLYGLKKVKA